jgi:hypothetical protein
MSVVTSDPSARERAPLAGAARDAPRLASPTDPEEGSVARMFRFERRWLVRVFETLLPSKADPRLPIGAADVPMGRFVDDLLAHAPLEFVMGLRIVLWAVMLAPIVVFRRLRTFLALSSGERLQVLERLRSSDVYILREAPILLKTIACLGFCGLPNVQASLGIHPVDVIPPDWAAKDEKAS